MNGVSKASSSHRREEIGAGALLELAAGLGTETTRSDGGTMALRLQHLAAVGLGDQAAKREAAAGNGGMASNRRATGSLEHGEEGALGGERGRGRRVTDGAHEIERVLVVCTGLAGGGPPSHRRPGFVHPEPRGSQ